jgi:hypothetical protein
MKWSSNDCAETLLRSLAPVAGRPWPKRAGRRRRDAHQAGRQDWTLRRSRRFGPVEKRPRRA